MSEITEIKCGKLTTIDLITRRYVLDTNSGAQYTLAGNDEKLSLYDDSGEIGQISMEKEGSGSIFMERDGKYEQIGEYQKIETKYRVLVHENFAALDVWREDFHPLDLLIEKILSTERK